jgi:hypothetical protein
MTAGGGDNLHPTLLGADYLARRWARALAYGWDLRI